MRRHHRTTAVLGRDSPPSTHTAWMESAGFERLDVLDAHVVLPTIDEVVLVKETLMEAEPEIGEAHEARIEEAIGAMLMSVNREAMEMLVTPAECDLQRSMQVGNPGVASNEQASPKQRPDAMQGNPATGTRPVGRMRSVQTCRQAT